MCSCRSCWSLDSSFTLGWLCAFSLAGYFSEALVSQNLWVKQASSLLSVSSALMLSQLIEYVMLDYRQKRNCIVLVINPPRSQWVPQCLNTGLRSSSCLSVSLEQLNEHICFSWTDQTIVTDPRLELWLWLVLFFFCELGNFRTTRSETTPNYHTFAF